MFTPKSKTAIDQLETELATKRAAHDTAVANFTAVRTRADALADQVAAAAFVGGADLQDLEHELDAAERRARAFASARNAVGIEIRELEQRLNHEKTRDKREAVARYLESIADEIVAVVAEFGRAWHGFRGCSESSAFPDLLSFAAMDLVRLFPHNRFLGAGAIASSDPEKWVATIRAFAAEIRNGRRCFELGATATEIAKARAASDNNVWVAIAAGARRLLKTA